MCIWILNSARLKLWQENNDNLATFDRLLVGLALPSAGARIIHGGKWEVGSEKVFQIKSTQIYTDNLIKLLIIYILYC